MPGEITSELFLKYNTRSQGQKYIKDHFQELIIILARSALACKDPSKEIQRHTESILKKILETLDELPYGIRHYCERVMHFHRIRARKQDPKNARLAWIEVGDTFVTG
jgi:hypothetical protein